MTENSSSSQTSSPSPAHSWWDSIAGKLTACLAIIASVASIIAAVPIVSAWLEKEPIAELARTPQLALEFWERTPENQYPMRSERIEKTAGQDKTIVHVEAKAKPFEIRLPTLEKTTRYGMHICAWTDDSIFNIKPGTDFSNLFDGNGSSNIDALESPFTPGKGISGTSAGDATLPITKKANSYWIRERLEHMSEVKDRVYFSKADDTSLQDRKEDLYLAIWIDVDANGAIDMGEYEYIVLHFK